MGLRLSSRHLGPLHNYCHTAEATPPSLDPKLPIQKYQNWQALRSRTFRQQKQISLRASCGVATRPCGAASQTLVKSFGPPVTRRRRSVSVAPGPSQFSRMPDLAFASAGDLVKCDHSRFGSSKRYVLVHFLRRDCRPNRPERVSACPMACIQTGIECTKNRGAIVGQNLRCDG